MANETKKIPSEVEFFFELDKDYRIIASNGVWGGLTPRGQLQLDFFVEKLAIPDSIKNAISEDGRIGKELSRSPMKRVVRRLQVGILLSIGEARDLIEFMNRKIAEYEKVNKGEA